MQACSDIPDPNNNTVFVCRSITLLDNMQLIKTNNTVKKNTKIDEYKKFIESITTKNEKERKLTYFACVGAVLGLGGRLLLFTVEGEDEIEGWLESSGALGLL